MTHKVITEEEYVMLQAKKEELEADFHQWLSSHFASTEVSYINDLVDLVDDEDFLKIAEKWAFSTKKSKVFY